MRRTHGYTIRLAVALLVEYRYTKAGRMLPHSEYVHSEQFDAILVTSNSTVYEQSNSSPLLPSRSIHSTYRQQKKTEWFYYCEVTSQQVSMSHACQHVSRKPVRITSMTQTPQTGTSTIARGSLRRCPCLRVVLCTNLLRERGAFRMWKHFFFWH